MKNETKIIEAIERMMIKTDRLIKELSHSTKKLKK